MVPSRISGFIILYPRLECKIDPTTELRKMAMPFGTAIPACLTLLKNYSIGRRATTKFLRQ